MHSTEYDIATSCNAETYVRVVVVFCEMDRVVVSLIMLLRVQCMIAVIQALDGKSDS